MGVMKGERAGRAYDIVYDVRSPCRKGEGRNIYVCGLRRSTFLCVGYVMFYVSFVIAGAAVFAQIEQPEQDKLVERLKLAKLEFIDKNPGLDRKCV